MDDLTSVVVPPKSFPTCIVWTPIPLITALFPFVGHMGVCSSQGTIFDFAGAGVVRGDFAFGNPIRYVQLRPDAAAALTPLPDLRRAWDSALEYSSRVFSDRMYNLCGCNCHNLVAHFLEQIRFAGHQSWNIVYLGWLVFRYGRFVSVSAALYTWLPFLAVASLLTWWLGPGRAAAMWALVATVTLALLLLSDGVMRGVRRRQEAEASFDLKYGRPPYTWTSSAAGFWDGSLKPLQYIMTDPIVLGPDEHVA